MVQKVVRPELDKLGPTLADLVADTVRAPFPHTMLAALIQLDRQAEVLRWPSARGLGGTAMITRLLVVKRALDS
jgi:hypothetical protein